MQVAVSHEEDAIENLERMYGTEMHITRGDPTQ
jgi:hypothetical protein